ncbi:MAG TPA: cytochrome c peroxidase [Edaphocola sp.]|nr:cytochrome c peroxidase [Edaphocola sp.]
MTNKKLVIFSAAIISVIATLSAFTGKKDKSFDPKPYSLELPEFVSDYFEPMPIPKDNILTEEGVELGKYLYYDGILSLDRSMSCAACHRQEYAFSDPRQFSIGVRGDLGQKQSMSTVNLGWNKHFFWDGRANSLEQQANDPITNPIEMASSWEIVLPRLQNHPEYPKKFLQAFGTSTITKDLVLKAIAQFERTIVSFDSKFDKYFFQGDANALTPQEERGLELFFGGGTCNHCHSDVLLTDNFFRNNGLDLQPDSGLAKVTKLAKDIGKMKVPTLRNIAMTAPYMHDGRFKTLEEVVDFYLDSVKIKSPNIDEHMDLLTNRPYFNQDDRKALVAFLKTFTDSSLLTNPKYKDPFAF